MEDYTQMLQLKVPFAVPMLIRSFNVRTTKWFCSTESDEIEPHHIKELPTQ